MKHCPLAGDADAYLLQEFTALAIGDHGRVRLTHPGDVVGRIYNALRREDPDELIHIWEDDDDLIQGLAVDHPASGLLYRSEGSEPIEQLVPYRKTVGAGLQ